MKRRTNERDPPFPKFYTRLAIIMRTVYHSFSPISSQSSHQPITRKHPYKHLSTATIFGSIFHSNIKLAKGVIDRGLVVIVRGFYLFEGVFVSWFKGCTKVILFRFSASLLWCSILACSLLRITLLG